MLQKNAVSGQNANNFLKSTSGELGCCGDSVLDCQYTATYTQANTVSAITIVENGADIVIPLTIGANSTAAQVQAALMAALVSKEYYDDNNIDWPGIVVTDLGTTLQIVITGNINVKSLTASGGTATFDPDCTRQGVCTYATTTFTGGAGSVMHINGSTQSLGTATPGTTLNADVKTAVEAALLAEGITATATVTNNGSTSFNISVTPIPNNTTLYLVGASGVKFYMARSGCTQVYN